MSNLNLGLIGNCAIGALIDQQARVVWACLPRFDGDPIFNALLRGPEHDPADGAFSILMDDLQSTEQYYEPNTAVLKTILHGTSGSVEITDCVPRFIWRDRMFRPQSIVRRLRPVSGRPRIKIQLRPTFNYGTDAPRRSHGSNHICYTGPDFAIRLTTDAPVDYILAETSFNLAEPVNLVLGPDETLSDGVGQTARHFEEQTISYWRNWTRRLALPFDWQDAVIRAAITLKLCTYEPTGAIIAAHTTSIPEAANSGRNWDYRFCWLRDAFFVVRALNSLAAVHTMEHYFGWLLNLVARAGNNHLQPVYGIGLEAALTERIEHNLPGYRGMGPVRVGNQAHEHFQHDVYGNLILGAVQTFFDHRLGRRAGLEDFKRLESVGEQAFLLYDQPDAGMWEAALPRPRSYLVQPHVLGRLRPPRQDRPPARSDRPQPLLGRTCRPHKVGNSRKVLVGPASGFCGFVWWRQSGCRSTVDGRGRLHRSDGPALREHGRAARGNACPRPLHDAL